MTMKAVYVDWRGIMASALLTTFLIEVEGVELTPYPDSAGYMTVGVGHLIKEEDDPSPITYAEAMQYLDLDTNIALTTVDRLVKVQLNYHEKAAVASWVFNLGEDKVQGSNTLALLNSGDKKGFADALLQWDKVTVIRDGVKEKVSEPGLLNRRRKERSLFLTGDWRARSD